MSIREDLGLLPSDPVRIAREATGAIRSRLSLMLTPVAFILPTFGFGAYGIMQSIKPQGNELYYIGVSFIVLIGLLLVGIMFDLRRKVK